MPHYHHVEYDDYVRGYREAQASQIALSGETPGFFAGYKVRKLAEWLPEFVRERPLAILDYGCGDGLMTSYVGRSFPRATVFGIDPSSRSIEYASGRYPSVIFTCVQGRHLPLADNSLDVIFASSAFHHIPFAEHHAHLDEIFRVLKPSGAFVLFELNPFNPFSAYVFMRSPFDRNAKLMFPAYSRRLLKDYGNVLVKYCSFFPAFLAPLRRFDAHLAALPLGAHYAAIVRPHSASAGS